MASCNVKPNKVLQTLVLNHKNSINTNTYILHLSLRRYKIDVIYKALKFF